QHYFIDEFQDTSILQWENLIPLIDNAVSTGEREEPSNSLMLVGDPKQAIYRWRGGYAEQFIKLSNGFSPFQNPDIKQVNLDFNFRSHEEIINFNNHFFTGTARFLDNEIYRDIYTQGNQQHKNHRTGGYVSINLVEAQTIEEAKEYYLKKTLTILNQVLDNGFKNKDICVLVRKNGEGIQVAQFLQEKEIPVISSQSLLIVQSAEVRFIVNLLRFMQQPTAKAISILLLEFLAENHIKPTDFYAFYTDFLEKPGQELFDSLPLKAQAFKLTRCQQLPLYEAAEYIVHYFDLNENAGAYLQSFLDCIFEFGQKNNSGVHGFLEWWEKNKDKLSIGTPQQTDAVQIMTIHKAKGLEFPVVIYPFAETPLYPNNDETNWYETEGEDFNGFESLLISQKKGLLNLDDKSAALYNEKRQQQQLDNLNMLYVALTRSVEQLHVITRITQKTEPTSDPKSFADLFVNYLDDIKQFDVQKDHYAFGNPKKISQDRQENKNGIQLSLISSPKENHNLFIVTKAERLWDESRTESINEGNLLHDILAGIAYETDIPLALKNARASGVLEQNRWEYFNHQLEKLVSELKVEGFFNIKHTVYNERELIHNERILRPDRVEFDSKNQAYLLDYKTGAPHSSHVQQINDYADALTASGMTIGKKILVYVNEKQTIHPV
ncbi:MAG: 3'-5' exonuclease, partial [Leeuwenhoekiella sp.]